ncbi:hypothetical protein NADFUDRAFT_82607 [Nadsonia fulvescens var. elongata DSM 6958]|uniref:Cyclin-like domain-containing protein n=1 Tax=Nadsonia fulvescens var. elongata DSM 6958 TaxID=857566 RepID=A0A1E3PJV0_9ASCO|nr:hypothetical protein NADFUDRAFT_82607 [Nadsonia fulvescens var. elongata DSM 6958]
MSEPISGPPATLCDDKDTLSVDEDRVITSESQPLASLARQDVLANQANLEEIEANAKSDITADTSLVVPRNQNHEKLQDNGSNASQNIRPIVRSDAETAERNPQTNMNVVQQSEPQQEMTSTENLPQLGSLDYQQKHATKVYPTEPQKAMVQAEQPNPQDKVNEVEIKDTTDDNLEPVIYLENSQSAESELETIKNSTERKIQSEKNASFTEREICDKRLNKDPERDCHSQKLKVLKEQNYKTSSTAVTPTRAISTTPTLKTVVTKPTSTAGLRVSPNNITPPTNSWLWRQSEIMATTPSRRDGISASEEMVRRSKGANFIIQVCLLLKLPSMTIYAATVYLQRFYQRFSLKYYQEYEIGATCVLLATKIEETNRYLRDIVIAVVKVAMKNFKLLITEQSKDFWRWRDVIIYMEEILLEGLCFDLNLESPFAYLEKYVDQLEINNVAVLCKSAWAFVNDSARTYLGIVFPANIIAGAGLYWAAKYNNTHYRLPKSLERKALTSNSIEPVTWLQALKLPRNDVKKCVASLVKFYEDLPILKEIGATYHKRHLESGEDRKRKATESAEPSTEPVRKQVRL